MALHIAFAGLVEQGVLGENPLADQVAAVSCGLCHGVAVCDLDYDEDSTAQADANFVLTDSGGIVEIQCTAEHEPFGQDRFAELLALAEAAVVELAALQRQALGLAE